MFTHVAFSVLCTIAAYTEKAFYCSTDFFKHPLEIELTEFEFNWLLA